MTQQIHPVVRTSPVSYRTRFSDDAVGAEKSSGCFKACIAPVTFDPFSCELFGVVMMLMTAVPEGRSHFFRRILVEKPAAQTVLRTPTLRFITIYPKIDRKT